MGLTTAILVVVANMIGTGVFTTTGLLVRDIGSPLTILVGWSLGGLIALCGALTYGELAAALSSNGGEYHFLSRLYRPWVGFVAGWISLVVGFSAPIAASAFAFGEYVHALWPTIPAPSAGVLLIIVVSMLHAVHVRGGTGLQNIFALAKVALILVFIAGGLCVVDARSILVEEPAKVTESLLSPAFAIGLIFISFAYSGWNGAAYIAGEVRRPERTLPLALVMGTGLVVLLYVGLNWVFLASAPPSVLAGKVEVGHVAAVHIFGQAAGQLLSGLIALALISSVSAMIMVGPRVYEAMGEDYRCLRFLSTRPEDGGPAVSIALQAVLAIVMLLTSSFSALLAYIGFTLSISAALTVGGIFILRRRDMHGDLPLRTWGYPATPLLFIGFSGWMIVYALFNRPVEALCGGLTIAVGLVAYLLVRRSGQREWNSNTGGLNS